jgi:nucleotide-binding universal stress UspA family protein
MFCSILVPLDHSLFAEQALATAISLAQATRASIDLALVHQQPGLANLRKSATPDEQRESDERYLEFIAHDVRTLHRLPVTSHVLEGDVVGALASHAARTAADTIVMTSHGRTGLDRARLGSVADGLVHQSPTPIFVVRPAATMTHHWRLAAPGFTRVLVPLDDSVRSRDVLPLVTALARATGATLELLRVVRPVPILGAYNALTLTSSSIGMSPLYSLPGEDLNATISLIETAERDLAALADALRADGVRNVTVAVVEGENIAQCIIDRVTAERCDAIAICTHARGVSRWIMGSVTDAVVSASTVPVLLCKTAHDTESPRAGSLDQTAALAPI